MDWSFLDHLGEEEEDVVEETLIVKVIEGSFDVAAPRKIVPTAISTDVVPPS